ncbi:Alkylated DNA repair protein alkB -like protein 1 [Trichinella zimbabwensis]|uniref:Alkylated DNA repair protein alkB-like protein 1 n=1 Tax=Trichinella zimbabwensis TaxID=268475 RepID=A0A0V1HP38_9BILA|nr:Alkylated DNA repair protein alkB -like protein 1 [Trichinella zimbabwensis]
MIIAKFYGNVCPNFVSTQSVVYKGHGHRTVTRTDDSSKETALLLFNDNKYKTVDSGRACPWRAVDCRALIGRNLLNVGNLNQMPAGVSWGQYAKTMTIFFLSSILGSSLVSAYYRPLDQFKSSSGTDAIQKAIDPSTESGSACFKPFQLIPLPDGLAANHLAEVGLHADLGFWKAAELSSKPGLILIRNAFTSLGQYFWVQTCMKSFPTLPHRSNLGGASVLGKVGTELVNNAELCAKLRWITFGYHHDWDSKVYSNQERSLIPRELVQLSRIIAGRVGYADYEPEATIINYYNGKTTMSGHVDTSERNLDAPLISVSLGQTAIFLIGTSKPSDPPEALVLRSGDIVVMSGPSRVAFHALPRVICNVRYSKRAFQEEQQQQDDTFELVEEIDPLIVGYMNAHRINLNIRQVD